MNKIIKKSNVLLRAMITTLLSVFLLMSCTTEIPTTSVKQWDEYTFRLEARPPIIEKGMMEFLTISDFEGNIRGWDLVVYYRMGPTGRWVQAIQDGHTGVYRRALMVSDPETDVLYVHVKKNQTLEQKSKKVKRDETVLQFPLNYSTAASSKSGL